MILVVKIALFLEALQLAAIGIFRACLMPRYRDIVAPSDVLILFVIPLVGLFGHDKNVFYAVLFVMPLFWAGNPTALVKRYVLALVLFPGLVENYAFGSLYLGLLSAPIFFNAGSLIALAMTRRGRLVPVRPIDAAIWLLFFVSLLFFARGEQVDGVLRLVVTTFLLVVPPYYIVARAVATERAAGDAASFIVLGGLCNAVIAIFESVKHWSMYQTFNQTLGVQFIRSVGAYSMRAGLLRAGGGVSNYEVLGLICGTSLLAGIALRRRFTVPGFFAIILLLTGGLFVSQARSAWIATLVGLVLQGIYDRRWKQVGIVAAGVGFVGVLALAASSGGTIGQLLGKGGHAETTGEYRQTLLDRGLEEGMKHPLTGQTLSQLSVSMNDMRQGEHIIDFVNTHLLVFLVGGLGALVLWLFAWTAPMAVAWGRRKVVGGGEMLSLALPFASTGVIFLFLTFTSPVDRILSLAAVSLGLTSVCVSLSTIPRSRVGPDRAARPRSRRPAFGPVELGPIERNPVPVLPSGIGGGNGPAR